MESSLQSHKNHAQIVDLLISMSIPVFLVHSFKRQFNLAYFI